MEMYVQIQCAAKMLDQCHSTGLRQWLCKACFMCQVCYVGLVKILGILASVAYIAVHELRPKPA